MQTQNNPLQITVNPPDLQSGMPGDTILIYVIVFNQGDKDAIVNLSLDFNDEFKNVIDYSTSHQQSLAIGSQQTSEEVKFELSILVNAEPGTYDYNLFVDSPEHYPEYPPINKPQKLKVQDKEHTAIRINDPTFSINPSSNPNQPLILKLGQPLQLEVIVDNRSQNVDSFRLSCPDLDEDWCTITYPKTGVEGTGISQANALNLTPNNQGKILLNLHPPQYSFAGLYSPNIELHSANNPHLKLLDLVYFDIQPIYDLNINLINILVQVSHRPASYEVSINNQGNVIRQLTFNLESRDEDQLYTYEFNPPEIKLLPNTSSTTNLTLKPRYWWRRPWWGGGLLINFQLNIEDQDNYPISNPFSQQSFIWKSRPWWQLLLLILVCLGLLGGTGFLVWRLLHPTPPTIDTFSTDSNTNTYLEGEAVALNWEIQRYKRLQSLELRISGSETKNNKYDFKNGIPENLQSCTVDKNLLRCSNYNTGITAKGNYTFTLEGSYRKGLPIFSRMLRTPTKIVRAEITEKPISEVVELQTDKLEYQKGEEVNVSWQISQPWLLKEVQINIKEQGGKLAVPTITYPIQDAKIANTQLQDRCNLIESQNLQCNNIPVGKLGVGKFTLEITALPNNGSNKNSSKQSKSAIEILPQPFQIVSFTLNGSEQLNQELEIGGTAILSWSVKGEDIQVKLDPYGDVSSFGTKELPVNQAFPSQIKLQVTDKLGKRPPQEKAFAIAVIKPIPPEPVKPLLSIPDISPVPNP